MERFLLEMGLIRKTNFLVVYNGSEVKKMKKKRLDTGSNLPSAILNVAGILVSIAAENVMVTFSYI